MIVCTGRATKRIDEFRDLDKEYTAVIKFGQTTPSFDLESQVDREYPADHITAGLITEKLTQFLGEQLQEPPLFSAKFVDGKRAYELARKKIERKLDKVKVVFHELELLEYTRKMRRRSGLSAAKAPISGPSPGIWVLPLHSGAHLAGLGKECHRRITVLEKALTIEEFKFILENMKQNDISNV
ncbi:MAG: hypothetical protein MZV63_21995 [Marinilabiliales bacterium]|nr:hypothetical protein [Marinilabiliales bacterium]